MAVSLLILEGKKKKKKSKKKIEEVEEEDSKSEAEETPQPQKKNKKKRKASETSGLEEAEAGTGVRSPVKNQTLTLFALYCPIKTHAVDPQTCSHTQVQSRVQATTQVLSLARICGIRTSFFLHPQPCSSSPLSRRLSGGAAGISFMGPCIAVVDNSSIHASFL